MIKKKIIFTAFAALMVFGSYAKAQGQLKTPAINSRKDSIDASQNYSPRTLIIYYDGKRGKARLLKDVKRYKAKVMYKYGIINAIAITIPEGKSLDESIKHFENVKGVLSVNKDYIYHLD
jgi:hypothetical protein